LPAICREPAANPVNAVCLIQRRVWTLIVPTLRVGMPGRMLCVHNDAERQSLRYHAERGNDQTTDTEPCRSVACPAICCAAAVKPCALAMSGEPHSPDLLPLRVRSSECGPDTSHAPTGFFDPFNAPGENDQQVERHSGRSYRFSGLLMTSTAPAHQSTAPAPLQCPSPQSPDVRPRFPHVRRSAAGRCCAPRAAPLR